MDPTAAPQVEMSIARPEDRAAVVNMMQLYTHDFSEHWAGRPDGELDEDGRFAEYDLAPYWREAGHVPLLVRAGGHLAGFALLNRTSHSGESVDRNVAEFFIVRKHRRGGMGTFVAQTILSRYPGRWEAAVARRNLAALAFWRRAISSHAQAREIEEIDVTSEAWNGPVIRFSIVA